MQTNEYAARCLVPNVVGGPVGPYGGNDLAYEMLLVGCAYHLRTVTGSHKPRQPLVIKSQALTPGTEISSATPIEVTAGPAPARYGRCHVPPASGGSPGLTDPGFLAIIQTRAAVLLESPTTGSI